MKILVINTGSSSIKYKLFNMQERSTLVAGLLEKIGEPEGMLTHIKYTGNGTDLTRIIKHKIQDHKKGLQLILGMILDKKYGAIQDKAEIKAIGHRVVHGGEAFHAPVIINKRVIKAIKEHIPLAPLHNPSNLGGINVAGSIFPDAIQTAVFDTAFHQTIPQHAFLYALPFNLYKNDKIRKYGFHGTSHAYVAIKAADFLEKPLEQLNLITLHLGNGASMAAIKHGRCIDTSMGMTPLEGLVMGTRCGDLDPALPLFLANLLKMSLQDIDRMLNQESGLKGLCGASDMREILQRRAQGDTLAKNAVEVYCYRIKKYIGAYSAVLGKTDALIFTGGVGKNSSEIRSLCCRGLTGLGIQIAEDQNLNQNGDIFRISPPESKINILVVQTDEELMIARETEKLITGNS